MRKFALVLALALLTSVSFAQMAEDFEGEDTTTLTDAGWTLSPWGDPVQFPAIETSIVHSGSQSLALPMGCRASYPIDGYGTLNVWIYDNGDVFNGIGNTNGSQWGIGKDVNWIGGGFVNRTWLGDNVAYAVSTGRAGDVIGNSLYGPVHMDAGLSGEPSRGVAGWMNWEITYHEDGTIQVDLLKDPNGFEGVRHQNTLGEGAAPAADGTFAQVGGATTLHFQGSRSANPSDTALTAYGVLYIDDITWTPASECGDGDIDCDGDVDIFDFLILKANYGTSTGATREMGDLDEDGDVDIFDFLILKANYGNTY